jgi:hypothetical protein
MDLPLLDTGVPQMRLLEEAVPWYLERDLDMVLHMQERSTRIPDYSFQTRGTGEHMGCNLAV